MYGKSLQRHIIAIAIRTTPIYFKDSFEHLNDSQQVTDFNKFMTQ